MKLACIGTGFVGVVTSAVFAKLGHEVVGLDIDENKVKSLSRGEVPFYEPDLENLLKETLEKGALRFTTSYKEAITNADVIFIMVGTPSASDGQADLKYVFQSAETLAPYLKDNAIVVIKSTVPPGTNIKLKEIIEKHTTVKFCTAGVPEFLKEGTAVQDTLHPDRILLGVYDEETAATLKELHKPLTKNLIVVKPESAQMTKYAANTYLAQRITFINQIADLCEKNGADIEEVIKGIGQDTRIGAHYWYPGLGYGGSCFPKDVKEIAAYSRAIGETDSLFIKIDELNDKRINKLMQKYDKFVGGFAGKTVAVLGLSFKPNTNDTREAPALGVIPWLIDKGASIKATDPKAITEAKKHLPESVQYFKDVYETTKDSDVVIHLIEWEDYLNLDLNKLGNAMNNPKYFIDTRNQYEKDKIEAAGFKYKGVGR